jgi:hypothetical protein
MSAMEAELASTRAEAAAHASALLRAKQHAADLSEDLEAANRELAVSPCTFSHVRM